jgi:hypothetical protein
MTLPLVLFAVAAAGGLVMAVLRLSGKPTPPLAIAVVHGALAAGGLVTLILALAGSDTAGSGPKVALALFLAAAAGGFVMFFQHLKGRAIPIPLMFVHALAALVGVIALWMST